MNPLYTQLMDSKSAPRVAPKANITQLGTAPMNLRSAMQKYARGGDVDGDVEKTKDKKQASRGIATYDYNAPKNGDRIKIPGVAGNPEDGKVIVFWDHANKRVVVSDEGYWNADSPVGDELKKAVKWANDQGYQAGVVTTPYASNRFGDNVRTAGGFTRMRPPATDQQLRDYVDAADFVVTDPYILDPATSTPEMQDNFANFTKNVGDYANSQGKDTWLVLQGFNIPSVDPAVTQAYNDRLANENAGRYNNLSFFTPEVFTNGETPVDTQQTFSTATQAAQPFKMAEKTGLDLPADWNSYGAKDKIDWFNEKNVSPDALATSGVAQGDIDWMMQNSYTGNTAQQPQRMMAQAQPQEMTGIAALGGKQAGYDEGFLEPTSKDDELRAKVLGTPYASQQEIEDFNRSLYAPNPNEYGRPQIATPVDPMPQTGGYDQPPPAQQQTDDYLNQFNNLMQSQVTPAAPDYSRSYAALGGADSVNSLRNQFLQSGLDENTIGSIFSQYYAPEQLAPAQQPDQQMARGGMAHSNIEQYLTRLGMVRK